LNSLKDWHLRPNKNGKGWKGCQRSESLAASAQEEKWKSAGKIPAKQQSWKWNAPEVAPKDSKLTDMSRKKKELKGRWDKLNFPKGVKHHYL